MTIEWIHPDELKNHPTNLSIYGDTPDQELVESVRRHGVFDDHPIGYVQDGDFKRIVSGHRRNQAAKITKQESVPIVRLKAIEGDELAIEERIILSNKQRVKTKEQMAREAARLVDIEAKRAQARKEQSLKQNTGKIGVSSVRDGTIPHGETGRSRTMVAEALGVGETTARDLIKAGKALESAEKKGQASKVAKIKQGLTKSAAAGARAAEPQKADDASKPKSGNAGTLLSKVTADFARASENMAPLVRAWDAMKADDPAFQRKHQELLAHHSRLFQYFEDAKRVIKKLNEVWGK